MNGPNYCNTSVSWDPDQSKDVTSVLEFKLDAEESGDDNQVESSPRTYTQAIEISSPEDGQGSSGPCEMTFAFTKPQYSFCMQGFTIVSDAKNVEVYSDTKEYLCTCKGQILANEESNSDVKKYKTSWKPEGPVKVCTVKFVSLQNKNKMCLYSIELSIVQSDRPVFPPSMGSKIDVEKVKHRMTGMPDIPEGAKGLLETMEQYKKNQSETLSGMKDLISGASSLSSEKRSSLNAMSGLMAMVANMSAVNRSATTQENQGSGDTANGQQGLYSMLHNICSQVGKNRQEEKERQIAQNTSVNDVESSNGPTQPDTVNRTEDNTDIKAVLQSQLEEMEKRIMANMKAHIDRVEARLHKKLDKILSLLSERAGSDKNSELIVDETQPRAQQTDSRDTDDGAQNSENNYDGTPCSFSDSNIQTMEPDALSELE